MKAPSKKSKLIKTRQLTVCRLANGRSKDYGLPEIRLRGQWLKDTGFEIGQIVTIVCSPRTLRILTDGTRKYATPLKDLYR